MEKAVKVSLGIYDQVKALADKGGVSIRDTLDELARSGLKQLNSIEKLTERIEADPNITITEVDGVVYYCEQCGHPLDPKEEIEKCPKCEAKLQWDKIEKPGGGFGFIGWGLVTLLALGVLNTQRRTNMF